MIVGLSPPSRGAWIEMFLYVAFPTADPRRPPRGGRGLKSRCFFLAWCCPLSPPSRGAWIEIRLPGPNLPFIMQSPPSRGAWIEIKPAGTAPISACSRPPRGGRGLKFAVLRSPLGHYWGVAPLAGGVD